jgi:hypothetical protein
MKRLFQFIVSVMVIHFLVSGCASIVGKTNYPITINSQPDRAQIRIIDETGKAVFEGNTPTTVTLKSGRGYFKGHNYTISFKKEGYNDYQTEIHRGISGWYIAGNLVFGGLIGWLIVDPLTGAMWTLPPDVSATLTSKTSLNDRDEGIRILSLNQLPAEMQGQLIRIH